MVVKLKDALRIVRCDTLLRTIKGYIKKLSPQRDRLKIKMEEIHGKRNVK